MECLTDKMVTDITSCIALIAVVIMISFITYHVVKNT